MVRSKVTAFPSRRASRAPLLPLTLRPFAFNAALSSCMSSATWATRMSSKAKENNTERKQTEESMLCARARRQAEPGKHTENTPVVLVVSERINSTRVSVHSVGQERCRKLPLCTRCLRETDNSFHSSTKPQRVPSRAHRNSFAGGSERERERKRER